MDPGTASFEPRTPNVRPPDFWEVGFHDSVSPARPSITQIEPDMRDSDVSVPEFLALVIRNSLRSNLDSIARNHVLASE